MKRFGYYVRLGGDREISEALARGDAGAMMPVPRASSEAVRRDNSGSEAVRRVAMMRHTPEEWREMRLDARRRYRRNRKPQGVGKALLVGYAMVCYGARWAFDWLWEAIERRTET